MTPGCLIRLSLAEAMSTQAFSCPKLGLSWKMKSEADLTRIYESLVKKINNIPYGPYDALKMLVGEDLANHLVTNKKECIFPPEVAASLRDSGSSKSTSSESKRSAEDDEEESDSEAEKYYGYGRDDDQNHGTKHRRFR